MLCAGDVCVSDADHSARCVACSLGWDTAGSGVSDAAVVDLVWRTIEA